jgi:hypothetical protein
MGLSGSNSRRCMVFAGVIPPSVLRGRALSSVATSSRRSGEWTDRSVPLAKYWRNNPFVFSLELAGLVRTLTCGDAEGGGTQWWRTFAPLRLGRGGVGRVREQHFPRAPSHRLRTIRGYVSAILDPRATPPARLRVPTAKPFAPQLDWRIEPPRVRLRMPLPVLFSGWVASRDVPSPPTETFREWWRRTRDTTDGEQQ